MFRVVLTEAWRLFLPALGIGSLLGLSELGIYYGSPGSTVRKISQVFLSAKVLLPLAGVLPAVWLCLTAFEMVELWLDRSRRMVRLDIDEIEMMTGGRRQYIAFCDILSVRLTQPFNWLYRLFYRPEIGLQIYKVGAKGRGIERIT